MGKTVTAPLSRLTILSQVNSALPEMYRPTPGQGRSSSRGAPSLLGLTRHVLKTQGLLAFWRGNLTSCIHRFPYSAINFASYETCRSLVMQRSKSKEETPVTRLGCWAVSGAIACATVYPLDLIRTRITVQCVNEKNKGIMYTFRKILVDEGTMGLYRGKGI